MNQQGAKKSKQASTLLVELLGALAENSDQEDECLEPEDGLSEGNQGGSDDLWLTVRGAAERIHVSRTTIYRLVREGKLPVCKAGGRVLINRETLDSCLKDGLLA